MSTDVAIYQGNQLDIDLIRKIIAPTVTNDEFDFFIARCKQSGLDPIARQIYAISRYDAQVGGNKMNIQVSIDGMRLLAERSGKYAGQIGPEYCGKDGKWVDVWLEDDAPSAARVGVIRSDFASPLYAVAKYSSYVQTGKNGITPLWKKMPDLMLGKCAESLALRRAFPAETSGFYTREEMAQAENDLPAQVLAQETVIDAPVTITITDESMLPAASNGHAEPEQSDNLKQLLAKARLRGVKLGIRNIDEWLDFMGQVTGKKEGHSLADIAKINGELTAREKAKAS